MNDGLDIMKIGILPIIGMILVLIVTNEIYMVEGSIDFIRLWMCVGIPFGITKIGKFWVLLSANIVTLLGGLLVYFTCIGFAGGFIAIFMIAQAVIVLIHSAVQHYSGTRAVC